MTTDTVAALLGERVKADLLVKGSNVNGIYTKDPKKYRDAKKLDKLKFEELAEILEADSHTAGINQVIDPEAVKILTKNRLKTIVVDGYDTGYLVYAVQGRKVGTLIE
jgi:uridylate kinase